MQSVILSARRSAVCPRGGAFAAMQPHELAAPVINQIICDAGIDPDDVDELILANALGAGGNPARVAVLASNLPDQLAGVSIDTQCAGGLDAIIMADMMIRSGQARMVIAGGVESYSRRPLRSATFADGRQPVPYEQAPFTPWPDKEISMAEAAHKLAERYSIDQTAQDSWAIESHQRALRHQPQLSDEIITIAGQALDPFTRNLTHALTKRAPVVAGTITNANMAVAADAASLVLLAASDHKLATRPKSVRVTSTARCAISPDWPGLAALPAIEAATRRANIKAEHIGTAEIMEAFAVQAKLAQQLSGLSEEQVNPNGGALAHGHPISASGAILVTRLFHQLKRKGGTGMAAIPAAGGVGSALVLDAVN